YRGELALERGEHPEALDEALLAAFAEADELGAPVGRIGDALGHSHVVELVDELLHRLLRDPEALGEIGEAYALEGDVREQAGVRHPNAIVLRRRAGSRDGLLVREPR